MENGLSILLTSGGLDSTTLAYWLTNRSISFVPVFVNYGQHSAVTELETVQRVLPDSVRHTVEIVNVSSVYQGSSSRMLHETNLWNEAISDDDLYVPYRNQLLLTIGSAIAVVKGCKSVYSGFIESNLASGIDCSADFLRDFSSLAKRYGGIEFHFPFKDFSKAQVARLGIEHHAPIVETYSCLVRSATPCGACANCLDRANALSTLGC